MVGMGGCEIWNRIVNPNCVLPFCNDSYFMSIKIVRIFFNVISDSMEFFCQNYIFFISKALEFKLYIAFTGNRKTDFLNFDWLRAEFLRYFENRVLINIFLEISCSNIV